MIFNQHFYRDATGPPVRPGLEIVVDIRGLAGCSALSPTEGYRLTVTAVATAVESLST